MKTKFVLSLIASLLFIACNKSGDTATAVDIEETAQQVGDAMASIDEAGGSSGSIALMNGSRRTFARLAPDDLRPSPYTLISEANATTCGNASTFGSCTSNVITRNYGGCTIGAATFTGSVTLTWTDATVDNTCAMTTTGHHITRVPAFTVTGRRGATLTVSKSGTNGQVLTRGASANALTFTNDGIRRVFALSGVTLFDFTSATTSAISVTGSARAGRVVSGGALRVTNNSSGVTCDYVPTAVTWTSSCVCPTSGSWATTCSDGRASNINITGCGTADFTMGSESESVVFDRCY